MANPFYVTVQGQVQKEIAGAGSWPGEDSIKGHEKDTMCYAFTHEIKSPRDIATGQASGKRQHKPLKFLKRKDKSSPQFYQALVTNENLPTVVFKWYRPKVRASGEEHYYTIELTNANVCEIQDEQPDTLAEEVANAHPREWISMTYQRITWTWVLTGVTSLDDWMEPVNG